MQKYGWLLFVAGAVLTWGAYVVTIDHGRNELAVAGVPKPVAAMRAFLFIGLAYFILGVVFPGIYLWMNTPAGTPTYTSRGVVLSTIAGLLGAAGALCIVFAVGRARQAGGAAAALYVAPLVFSFAPIVNCLISLIWDPPGEAPKPWFFLGLVLAALGAGMVLFFKPQEKHPVPAAPKVTAHAVSTTADHPA